MIYMKHLRFQRQNIRFHTESLFIVLYHVSVVVLTFTRLKKQTHILSFLARIIMIPAYAINMTKLHFTVIYVIAIRSTRCSAPSAWLLRDRVIGTPSGTEIRREKFDQLGFGITLTSSY